jgi:hypothetical protein
MKSINAAELNNPDVYPDENVLSQTLGKSYCVYLSLLEMFSQNDMTHEWRYYKDGKTWLCKVQHEKRTIVWMSAERGFIKAAIHFPEKYISNVCSLNISTRTRETIEGAKNTAKSSPCIFELKTSSALRDFSEVMQFKLVAK